MGRREFNVPAKAAHEIEYAMHPHLKKAPRAKRGAFEIMM